MPAVWGKICAAEILTPVRGNLVSGKKETVFSGLSTDSRNIRPGELFWALIGERFDGHDFIQNAIDRGAAGILLQKGHPFKVSKPDKLSVIAVDETLKALGDLAAWWRHQHNVRVVAITGSSGKTTTKEMAASILEMSGSTLVSQGNFNNLIGLPITLLKLEEGHHTAILEMGMNRPGEIARLTEIADPDVGVITNVGMAHLEGLGDIQGVANAKAELIENISSNGQVILNGDDRLLMKTAARFHKHFVTFGFEEDNDFLCTEFVNLGRNGSSFNIRYQGRSLPVRLNIPGIQNVSNAMAAAAACLSLHEPVNHVVEGLQGFSGIKGRFTLIPLPGDITLIDDTYNANPSSLKAALASVKALVEKGHRIIVGLGEMMELGDETRIAHTEAGRMVAGLQAGYFVAIGDHSREMIKGAVESGMNRDKALAVESHEKMIEVIYGEMKKGDLVFLKGSRKMDLGKVVDGIRNRCH